MVDVLPLSCCVPRARRRLRISILGLLDQEHHEERDDRRRGVDDELPRVRVAVDGALGPPRARLLRTREGRPPLDQGAQKRHEQTAERDLASSIGTRFTELDEREGADGHRRCMSGRRCESSSVSKTKPRTGYPGCLRLSEERSVLATPL